MKLVRSLPAVAVLLAVNVMQAADIPIANASFEADLTCTPSTTCATDDTITAWTGATADPNGFNDPAGLRATGSFGVFRPSAISYPSGVPNGANIAYLTTVVYSVSISQTLSAVLQANDTYTVTFYAGLRADTSAFGPGLGCSGYNVSLLAGGNLLYSLQQSPQTGTSCQLVHTGQFTKISFTFTSGANPAGLGAPLQILLSANGSGSPNEPAEVDFDAISVSDTLGSPVCNFTFNSGGEAFPAAGGSGTVNITTTTGCPWSLTNGPTWVTGATSGSGNGTLTFQVTANTGAARSATLTIAGLPFNVEQQAATIPGLNLIGSMPHIAAQENWTTSFTLVNKGAASTTARLSLFGDPSGPLTLPLIFPQQAGGAPELAVSLDRTITSNASLIITSAGPQTPPVQIGSAQLSGVGAVDGFAIFHLIPGSQEAVVPVETRNAGSYLLAYDNTGGVVLGVAVANVSAQAGTVGIVLRDDAGNQIGTGSLPMQASGHTSFVLSSQFPVTTGKRGTIEFDTPAGGQISVLGIRTTPLGGSNTLTTIPALASVGTNGGSIAHIATGNGWQTTFVLVNTGTSAAQVNLNFFADVTGTPLSLPLSFPQTGTGSTATSVNQSLPAGASLLVQSAAPLSNPAPTIGSAQLTTNGKVGGFVIFRYNPNGQEAVVPLESRTANGFLIAFDNTAGTATGIAINSVSSQAANVPVIIRDDSGNQIGTDTLNLAANGHLAFTLVSDKYAATANIRGTIEFDTPPGGQIGALGIRIPVAHTFTTLPALAK